MKLWISLSALLIVYFSYGFYISQSDVVAIPNRLRKENPAGFYDYRGVINIHSNLSIGSSSPVQIVSAAKAAGLDFLILTDLNDFDSPGGSDTYHGSTLLLNGGKLSYLDSRFLHYAPTGSRLGETLGEAQVRLADALTQNVDANAGHLLVLAHPFKTGFSWSGDFPTGADGFEVLNVKSLSNRAWESSKVSTLWSLVTYPFNPRLAFLRLFSEPTDELAWWDQTGQSRRIVGFAGAEASARAIPLAGYLVRFPSYQRSFEFVSNHVLLRSELTGNPTSDKAKLFQALKNGSFYLSVDLLGDPKGFNAWIEDRTRTHPMGAELKWNKSMVLRVTLPQEPTSFFEIVVYRDGERERTYNTVEIEHPIEQPGVYRVQVRVSPYLPLPDAKRWITWIYSNSFYLRP